MEWRCAWCGKPHESDDPPCDNCGHNKFEKAVEQVPARAEEPQGPVWVCPECGRQHQKHSPPCSRCGNLELEQRDVSELDDPLDDIGTRWRDVVELRYVVGYLAVGALLLVLGLGAVGVIDLPGFGEPDIPDAPGEAETAGNLSLDDVEAQYVAELNDRRQAASAPALSTDETVGRMAAYYNKAVVAAAYGDGDGPDSDAFSRFDPDCPSRPTPYHYDLREGEDAAAALDADDPETAASVLIGSIDNSQRFDELLASDLNAAGVDVHVAPDDRVFVTVVVC